MKMKLLVTALVIAGFAGSTFTADAKTRKHHKASSTTTGMSGSGMSGSGMGSSGMSGGTRGTAANPSGQGNVGPGTNNNAGPAAGGR